jgi:hypothetical protein
LAGEKNYLGCDVLKEITNGYQLWGTGGKVSNVTDKKAGPLTLLDMPPA